MDVAVDHLSFSYPRNPVFSNISFKLGAGDICSILGPNGAGKSTLLNCIGGYLSPTMGTVRLDNQDVATMDSKVRAQRIGMVAQMQADAPDLDVINYLALGRASRIDLFAMPAENEYRNIEGIMEEFGIGHLTGKPLSRLSGGERQQVEIARVLVQDTDVILMDEPTNHLDYSNQAKVLDTIRDLSRHREKTIILTTHTPDHAILLGGKTAILDGAGHLNIGPTDEIVSAEQLRLVFKTDIHVVWVEELNRRVCVTGAAADNSSPPDRSLEIRGS